jgi:hypothetical protein
MRDTGVKREFRFDGWEVVLYTCFHRRVVDARLLARLRGVNRAWRAFFGRREHLAVRVENCREVGKLAARLDGGAWDLAQFAAVHVPRLPLTPDLDRRSLQKVRVCANEVSVEAHDAACLERSMGRLRKVLGCVAVRVYVRRVARLRMLIAQDGAEALRNFVATHTWDCREALRRNVRGAVVTVLENIRSDCDLVVALSLMRTFAFDAVRHRGAHGLEARVVLEYVPPAPLPGRREAPAASSEAERRKEEARARMHAAWEADVAAFDAALGRRAAGTSFTDEELVEPRVEKSVRVVKELLAEVRQRRGRRKGGLRVSLWMCRRSFLASGGKPVGAPVRPG